VARIFGLLVFCISLIGTPPPALAQSAELARKSQQAKELMASGKFAEAVPLYQQLNQAVPNNPGLLLNLGMALHMAGDDRGSLRPLESAVKLDPRLEPAWLFLGTTRVQLGQMRAGIDALNAVLKLNPNRLEALEILGAALLSVDRAADAAQQYRKLIELDAASSAGWYGLGRSYEALSIRAFYKLQKDAPHSPYGLLLIADTRLREQQFASAFYLYRRAVEELPAMTGLHAALAEIYRRTGHSDWAQVEEEKEQQISQSGCPAKSLECAFRDARFGTIVAINQSDDQPQTLYWRSRAYNELALQAFNRLGQLPPSAEQHELKGDIYSRQKKYAEAVEEWKRALEFLPGDTQIQKQLAINLKFAQDYRAALPFFQELLRRQPASPDLNFLTGETLLDLQRAEEAIPLLRRAVRGDPRMLSAHKALARADLAIGNAADAIPHLKVTLAGDEDGSLHYQLARAYQASGQPDLAKQVLAQYQKLKNAAADSNDTARQMEITPP